MGIVGSTEEGELLGGSLWSEEDMGKVWEEGEEERRERTVVTMAGTGALASALASGNKPDFRAVTTDEEVGGTIEELSTKGRDSRCTNIGTTEGRICLGEPRIRRRAMMGGGVVIWLGRRKRIITCPKTGPSSRPEDIRTVYRHQAKRMERQI